jgi:hypothetical protein
VSALAAALVHSLWQGAAIALLVAAAAPLVRGARAREAAALAGLGLLVLLPAATTWLIVSGGGPAAGSAAGTAALPAARALTRAVDAGTRALLDGPAAAVAALLAVWLAGATILLVRLAAGVVGTRRLVGRGAPASDAVDRAVRSAADRLGVTGRIAGPGSRPPRPHPGFRRHRRDCRR